MSAKGFARCLWSWAMAAMLCGCGPKDGGSPQDAGLRPPEGPTKPASTAKAGAPGTITTKTGVQMVYIPAGEFIMGDDSGAADEKPAHVVHISAFWMDVHEVTQRSYESLMGQNPAKFKNPDHPVEQLGWYGAIRYCNMRSLREGLTPCYDLETLACDLNTDGYRLPTEAEWEYACRAQTTTAYSFGNDARKLSGHGWFEANAGQRPHAVGQQIPNAWALYDMHGNVWEWCNDWHSETYYQESPVADPCNGTPGDERILRGGGWDSPADECRSTARYSEEPGLADVCFGYDAFGFRCVRRIPEGADER